MLRHMDGTESGEPDRDREVVLGARRTRQADNRLTKMLESIRESERRAERETSGIRLY